MRRSLNIFSLSIVLMSIACADIGYSNQTVPAKELGLDEFIEIALRNNPAVDDARNQVWAAEGRSTQALSGYLPQLSASGEAARVHINDIGPIDEDNVLYGSVSGDQLIFDFGKTTGSIAAADHQVDAARAFLNSVGSDLINSVKSAYYTVLANYYLIQVANEQVNSYQKHYQRASEYYKAGVKSKIDVTNAQVELANSDLQLLQSQFALKSAKVNLEKIIGTAPDKGNYLVQMTDHDFGEFTSLLTDIPGSLQDLLQKASQQRPDLMQAQIEITSLESLLTSARGGYWPEIGAKASYKSYDTEIATLQDQWQLGIGLDWQFFSGFRTNGEVAEAKSNLRSSRAQLRDVELTAIQEVSDSYHLAQEKRDSVFLADKILKLAGENLDLADERYKSGLGDMIEFNDAQLRFSAARSNLVTTFFDYNIALANLDNAIGLFPNMDTPDEDQLAKK